MINQGYATLEGQGNRWRDYFITFVFFTIILTTNFIQDVLVNISYWLRGIDRKNMSTVFKWITLSDLISVIMSYTLYVLFAEVYAEDRTQYRIEERNYRMMLDSRDGSVDPFTLMIVIILCISLRICLNLVYTTLFGSFVQIIIRMGIDSFIFLCIFAIVIVISALIGTALFYDISQFRNFIEAFHHLFEAALGGFDFDIFESSNLTDPAIGKVYMSIYLLVSAILLLNFLIAIMSETYSRMKDYSIGMKMAEVIKIRPIYDDHPHYSCLVRSLHLLNVFVIAMLPFIVCCKSRRLNKIILRLEFLAFQI